MYRHIRHCRTSLLRSPVQEKLAACFWLIPVPAATLKPCSVFDSSFPTGLLSVEAFQAWLSRLDQADSIEHGDLACCCGLLAAVLLAGAAGSLFSASGLWGRLGWALPGSDVLRDRARAGIASGSSAETQQPLLMGVSVFPTCSSFAEYISHGQTA